MKIFCETVTVYMTNPSDNLPSSAWSRIWTRVQNPFEIIGRTQWVCFTFNAVPLQLPQVGDYFEGGTSLKTIRGEIKNIADEGSDLQMVIGQPSFPYRGPRQIRWGSLISPHSALRADYLGLQGRMVALVAGAYQSILDGGDVSVRFAKEETKVLSTLEPNEILTWQYYEKLRAEKIPYGGSVPPEEQRIRDLIYLTCGSRGMVI